MSFATIKTLFTVLSSTKRRIHFIEKMKRIKLAINFFGVLLVYCNRLQACVIPMQETDAGGIEQNNNIGSRVIQK